MRAADGAERRSVDGGGEEQHVGAAQAGRAVDGAESHQVAGVSTFMGTSLGALILLLLAKAQAQVLAAAIGGSCGIHAELQQQWLYMTTT